MTAADIVTDPFLCNVLAVAKATEQQCLECVSYLEAQSSSPSSSHLTADASLEFSVKQKRLFAQLASLRALNRQAVLAVRDTKRSTAEARQEIDRLHLMLQNLYYEQRHLVEEIAGCEGYDHKYQKLPLIPISDFLQLHPELADADENTLMRARIEHEHAEREQLEHARQELIKKKQMLITENKKRKEDLANLDRDLERFIDAAKPIQKTFEKEY